VVDNCVVVCGVMIVDEKVVDEVVVVGAVVVVEVVRDVVVAAHSLGHLIENGFDAFPGVANKIRSEPPTLTVGIPYANISVVFPAKYSLSA